MAGRTYLVLLMTLLADGWLAAGPARAGAETGGDPADRALALAAAFTPTGPPTRAAQQTASARREIEALVQRSFAAPRDSVPIYCRRAEEMLLAAGGAGSQDTYVLVRLALVNGRLAEFEGNTQKIARVRRVDECCRLAIARDSTDALPYILLGALNYRLSSLSWVERTMAKALIGDLPRTSLADAERFLRHALRLRGGRPCCFYALGRTLEAMDRDQEAVDVLRRALAGGQHAPLDAHYQRMARERLREIEETRARVRPSWQEPGEGGT